jgi:hypothetical protein
LKCRPSNGRHGAVHKVVISEQRGIGTPLTSKQPHLLAAQAFYA